MAVKNLVIRGGADFSNVKRELDKTQKTLNNFKQSVSSTMKKIGVVLGSIALGGLIKDSTKAAMSVESSIENINRTMQNSAKSFGDFIKMQSSAYGMSIQEAYKYGSTYSNLISSFESSTSKVASSTQELMKATGIIASKTGRTYEDTADRIRSGMLGSTEAIEDLGVYTQVSMLESTEAFRKFAGDKSWAQLDFQVQQQIRLAAILEQTYARYGDTLVDTTQSRHNTFIASLKNVQLTLGQAFLPIYNAILPPLTAFMNVLSKVISLISQFTTALFGAPKAANNQAQAISSQASAVGDLSNNLDSAGDSASGTAKKLKGALAGFDEINSLSKSDSGESSGGEAVSGGVGAINPLDGMSLEEGGFLSSIVQVNKKVQEFADKIKTIFSNLKNEIIKNKDVIIAGIAGIVAGFIAFKVMTEYTTVVSAISKVFTILKGAILALTAPIIAIPILIGALVASLVYLYRTDGDFRNQVNATWKGIKETVSNIWNSFLKPTLEALGTALLAIYEHALKPLLSAFMSVLKSIAGAIMELWDKALKPFVDWFVKSFGPLLSGILRVVLAAVTTAIIGITNIFAGLIKFLSGVFTVGFSAALNLVTDSIKIFKNSISSNFEVIKGIFNGILNFIKGVFTGNWRLAFQGLSDIVSNIFKGIVNVVKLPINAIILLVNSLISGLNKISIDIPSWVPGFGGKTFGINIPKIPYLAKGGIVDNPTLAMVGEAGKEAVVPLENNTAGLDLLASKLLQGMNGGNSNDKPIELTIKIGDTVIGKKAIDGINKITRQTGKCQLIF